MTERSCTACIHHRVVALRGGGTEDGCADASLSDPNGDAVYLRRAALRSNANACGGSGRWWWPR